MYEDFCMIGYHIEQFNDILIAKSNASMAGGMADLVFLVGAVDVDESIICVLIIQIVSCESQNTGENKIFIAMVLRIPNSIGFSRFENGSDWCIGTDFFADLEIPNRSAVTAFDEAHAFGTGGNTKGFHGRFTSDHLKCLIVQRNFDAWIAVHEID
jgi:hypothetical protein